MDAKQKWLLLAICIITVLSNLDFTAVNLAVLPISRKFHASIDVTQWILSAYTLAAAIITLPAGRWADAYGGRKVFLAGCWTFLIGSVIAVLSHSIEMLIFGRIVQGFACGVVFPAIYGMIANYYSEKEQAAVFSIFTLMVGVGLILGPSLGGVFVRLLNWRWIFYINIPTSLLSIMVATFMLKDSNPSKPAGLSYFSVLTVTIALVGSLLAINNLTLNIFSQQLALILSVVAVVALCVFAINQYRSNNPLVPLSIFQYIRFRWVLLFIICLQYIFASVLYIGAIYLQEIQDLDPLKAGLAMMAMTAAYALSPISGKLIQKYSVKPPLALGFAFTAVGSLMLAFAEINTSMVIVCTALFVVGIGVGFLLTAVNTALLQSVPAADSGTASSVFVMTAIYAMAAGLTIPTVQLIRSAKHHLNVLLDANNWQLKGVQWSALNDSLKHAHYTLSQGHSFASKQLVLINDYLHEAFLFAMHSVMVVCIGFSLLGLIAAFCYCDRGVD